MSDFVDLEEALLEINEKSVYAIKKIKFLL